MNVSQITGHVGYGFVGTGMTVIFDVAPLRSAILSLQVLAGHENDGIDAGVDADGDSRISLAEAVYFLQLAAELR